MNAAFLAQIVSLNYIILCSKVSIQSFHPLILVVFFCTLSYLQHTNACQALAELPMHCQHANIFRKPQLLFGSFVCLFVLDNVQLCGQDLYSLELTVQPGLASDSGFSCLHVSGRITAMCHHTQRESSFFLSYIAMALIGSLNSRTGFNLDLFLLKW